MKFTPLKIGASAATLCLIGVGTWAKITLPNRIKTEIDTAITTNCPSCKWGTNQIQVGYFPPKIILIAPRIIGGNPHATGYDAVADRVSVVFRIRSIFSKGVEIKEIFFDSPKVIVTEGDIRSPRTSNTQAAQIKGTPFSLSETKVKNGEFTYIRVHAGKHATLHVTDIQGQIEALGTTPDLVESKTRATADGHLEQKGKFQLAIELPLFSDEFSLKIDLHLIEQPLHELNSYFETNDGIKFSGTVHDGRSSITIHKRKMKQTVQAKYSQLDVHFESTKERSGLSAFFSNLGTSLKLHESSMKNKPKEQARTVEIERGNDETIFKFIFRGMEDAALKIAKGD